MTDYVSSLSDLNLILLSLAVFLAVVQLFLLFAVALKGATVTLWYGWIALAIGVYLVVQTR